MWHEGEKDPYVYATRELVERKRNMGLNIVAGFPYSREALDIEALGRVSSWGYIPDDYDAAYAQYLAVGGDPNSPAVGYFPMAYSYYTPEAIIGEYASGDLWPEFAQFFIPFAPEAESIPLQPQAMARSYP